MENDEKFYELIYRCGEFNHQLKGEKMWCPLPKGFPVSPSSTYLRCYTILQAQGHVYIFFRIDRHVNSKFCYMVIFCRRRRQKSYMCVIKNNRLVSVAEEAAYQRMLLIAQNDDFNYTIACLGHPLVLSAKYYNSLNCQICHRPRSHTYTHTHHACTDAYAYMPHVPVCGIL